MPHLLTAREAQAYVRNHTQTNARPLQEERPLPHKAHRDADGKKGGQGADGGRNAEWHVGDGVVGQKPAAAND